MKAIHLRTVGLVLGLAILLVPLAAAQDDVVAVESAEPAAPAKRETRFLVEYEYSLARTVGTDLRIGTIYDPAGSSFGALYLPEETDVAKGLRAGWVLPDGFGELVASYRSFTASSRAVPSRPGEFVFGITEAYPLGHGIADDGFADAIDASAEFTARDAELSWKFPVAERPRFLMDVSVGVRTFDYKQDEAIGYFALDAGLPPLIEPGGGDLSYLAPVPDRMSAVSEFNGRGLQAGVQVVVPIIGDRLRFEATAHVGVLRGTARARYSSSTSIYIFDDGIDQTPLTFQEFLDLASQGQTGNLDQLTSSVALDSSARSTMNPVVELTLGLRSRVWKGLELAAGGRMAFVNRAVLEIRPKAPGQSAVGLPSFDGYDEQWRDAGFESFYATVGYRF